MSVQTGQYSIYTDARIHGSLSDLRDNEVETYLAEGGSIGFGIAVSRGTADNQAVVGGAGAAIGVTIRDLNREGTLRVGDITYLETEAMSVLRGGAINIAIPSGGSAGDALKYDDTTGVIDAGAPGAGESALTGAELLETVAAGEVAAVRISGQI